MGDMERTLHLSGVMEWHAPLLRSCPYYVYMFLLMLLSSTRRKRYSSLWRPFIVYILDKSDFEIPLYYNILYE
jgi:hypothetical protein